MSFNMDKIRELSSFLFASLLEKNSGCSYTQAEIIFALAETTKFVFDYCEQRGYFERLEQTKKTALSFVQNRRAVHIHGLFDFLRENMQANETEMIGAVGKLVREKKVMLKDGILSVVEGGKQNE